MDETTIIGTATFTGHAWWAPAAEMVFSVVAIVGWDGQVIRQNYAGAGPARDFDTARLLGQGMMRYQLDRIGAELRQAQLEQPTADQIQALGLDLPGGE